MQKIIKVYNFWVKDWHNYFVGKNSVLVHNQSWGTFSNFRTPSFKKAYNKLSTNIRNQADEAFQLFKQNPNHTSLNFEFIKVNKQGGFYSVRINQQYRAYGIKEGNTMKWFHINAHDYLEAKRKFLSLQ